MDSMAIENRLPKSRKGRGGFSTKALYLNRKEEAKCRLHHNLVVVLKAPAWSGILAGAVICTAEAEQTRNLIIRQSAVNLKENHSDLPQLPDSLPKIWEA